ncbi:MAG: chemotaxis protein CheW [bacterium]
MNEQMRKMGKDGQLVAFRLGREIYGIDIFKIQEVIHLQKITSIPNSPEFVEGVIEVRNQVIPVVNLKKRLGICEDKGDKQRIVILDLDDQVLGVVVDDISKVLQMDSEGYESLPDAVMGDREKACITRLAKTDDGLIIIITPERILSRIEIDTLKDLEQKYKQEPKDFRQVHKQKPRDSKQVDQQELKDSRRLPKQEPKDSKQGYQHEPEDFKQVDQQELKDSERKHKQEPRDSKVIPKQELINAAPSH